LLLRCRDGSLSQRMHRMLDDDMDQTPTWKRQQIYILRDGSKGTYKQALLEALESLEVQRREIDQRITRMKHELKLC
jgi:hypothetical protein